MGKNNNLSSGVNCSGDKKSDSFIIKIDHCQNETWQGKIIWVDENRTERFRSMLELIRLVDGTLDKNKGVDNLLDNQKIL